MNWKPIYHEPDAALGAVSVTAVCPKCGEPMWDDPRRLGWNVSENGVVLWKGFFTNAAKHPEEARRFSFLAAETNTVDKLPKYCGNCGERLGNILDGEDVETPGTM